MTIPTAPVNPNAVATRHDLLLTSEDNPLWLKFWRNQRTDFHQTSVNPLLAKFWPGLRLAYGSRVFVPLCGKSLDMLWLLQQGHEVIGVELSPVAVRAFFRENGLKPVKRRMGEFTCWTHGKLSILCGDYFALTPQDLGGFDTVYDRAALTALPEHIRLHYVAQLRRIVPKNVQVFLLTLEDAASNETLEHAIGIGEEITALYAAGFEICLAYVESVFEPEPGKPLQLSVRVEHKVYQLTAQ